MNPRPLGPEPSALPTALHPDKKTAAARLLRFLVGDERIELPRAESESAALPLCESPLEFWACRLALPSTVIYYSGRIPFCQQLFSNFSKKTLSGAADRKLPVGKHPVYIDKAGKNAVHLTYNKNAGWQSFGVDHARPAGQRPGRREVFLYEKACWYPDIGR